MILGEDHSRGRQVTTRRPFLLLIDNCTAKRHGLMVKRHHTCLASRSSGFEIPSVHQATEAERVRRLASNQQDGVRVPAAALHASVAQWERRRS